MTPILLDAEVLTPFYYHGHYAMDGSATDSGVITDTTLLFALRAALLGASPLLRGQPDYRADLATIPWRASLLMGMGNNDLLPPLRRTVDMDKEGGRSARMQKNMSSGFYKNQFFTHSVRPGAAYYGMVVGPDPFSLADNDELLVRIGVGRAGLLRLHRSTTEQVVRLNAATAQLFQRPVAAEYRILDTIRPSRSYTISEAFKELRAWFPLPQ